MSFQVPGHFSSVQKEDGPLSFCIDYHSLNVVKIKHHYPQDYAGFIISSGSDWGKSELHLSSVHQAAMSIWSCLMDSSVLRAFINEILLL